MNCMQKLNLCHLNSNWSNYPNDANCINILMEHEFVYAKNYQFIDMERGNDMVWFNEFIKAPLGMIKWCSMSCDCHYQRC